MAVTIAIPVMANNTTPIAKTKAWDSIETLGGVPSSVQKIEYAGSVFYLGNGVTETNFLSVITAGPKAVGMQTAMKDKLYSRPVYILWNTDKTTLLVHPIAFAYDEVLEAVSVPTNAPSSLTGTKIATPIQNTQNQPSLVAVQQPTEQRNEPIFFEEVTLLTNDELLALSEIAPTQLETRSAVTMTNTKMTDAEITAWGNEYLELGGINSFELEVVRLINEERAKHNLQPLAIMPHYMQAARMRSHEMYDLSYMEHRSPVYGSIGAVISLFGRNMSCAEAVTGKGTPEDTVKAWLTSTKGHREILLSQTAGAVGIGHVGNGKAGRTTALFIDGERQYIGYEITVNEYLNGTR